VAWPLNGFGDDASADVDSQYATSAGYETPGRRSTGMVPAERVRRSVVLLQ
jgi:hypothetical protein